MPVSIVGGQERFTATVFDPDRHSRVVKGSGLTADKSISTNRSSTVKIHQTLPLLLWAINLSAHANLLKPIDVSGDLLRYRHNPQAIAIFGNDIGDNPAIGAAVRSSLYFEQGMRAFRAKQYSSAVREYSRAIELHPTPAAFNNRGLAYWQIHDTDAAARDFTSALQVAPGDVHALANRGALMLSLQRYDEAINSLSQAIDGGHRSVDIYMWRGNAYFARGEKQLALSDYDAAIACAPSDPRPHVAKASAFYDDGKLDVAASEFQAALKGAPTNQMAMLGLAMVLRAQQRYGESVEVFNSALKVYPRDALLMSGRGRSYQEMGNWDAAIADYSRAIVLLPGDELLHRLRGLAYEHQGDGESAIADFAESTRLVPNNARGYLLWASALARLHRDDESIEVLSRAIRLMPTDTSLLHERAMSFEHKGDYVSAVRDYRTILQNDPSNVDERIFLADDETTLGEYAAAKRDYEMASRTSPERNSLLYGRAQLSFYSGDFRSADADFKRWQELYRNGTIVASNRQEYYVAIWRHMIALRLNVDDRSTLVDDIAHLDASRWPYPVLALYTGKTTTPMLLSAANDNDLQDRQGARCEANTYLGEWQLGQGNTTDARHSFEAASDACPVDFIEKTLARWELGRMGLNR